MHTPNVAIFGSCDIVDGHTHEQVYKKGRNESYEHNKIDGFGFMDVVSQFSFEGV